MKLGEANNRHANMCSQDTVDCLADTNLVVTDQRAKSFATKKSSQFGWFLAGLTFIFVQCLNLVSPLGDLPLKVDGWPLISNEEVAVNIQESMVNPFINGIAVFISDLEPEQSILVTSDSQSIYIDRFSPKSVKLRIVLPNDPDTEKTLGISTTLKFNGFLRVASNDKGTKTSIQLFFRHPTEGMVQSSKSITYKGDSIQCIGRPTFGSGENNFFCVSPTFALVITGESSIVIASRIDLNLPTKSSQVNSTLMKINSLTIGHKALYFTTKPPGRLEVVVIGKDQEGNQELTYHPKELHVGSWDMKSVELAVADPAFSDRLFIYSSSALIGYDKFGLFDIDCRADDSRPRMTHCITRLQATFSGYNLAPIQLFVMEKLKLYVALTSTKKHFVMFRYNGELKTVDQNIYSTPNQESIISIMPQVLIESSTSTLLPLIRARSDGNRNSVSFYHFKNLACTCSDYSREKMVCNRCSRGCFPYKSTCQNADFLLSKGYGWNKDKTQVLPCSSPNCLSCRNDNNRCDLCEKTKDTMYYKHPYEFTCVATPPIGFCLPQESFPGDLVACKNSGCKTCVIWKGLEICLNCFEEKGYFMFAEKDEHVNTTYQVCKHIDFAKESIGIDVFSKVYRPCIVPQCANCTENYRICLSCYRGPNDTRELYLYNDPKTGKQSCNNYLPEGFGRLNRTLHLCSKSKNCLTCKFVSTSNSSVEEYCLTCKRNSILSPDNRSCVDISSRSFVPQYSLDYLGNNSYQWTKCKVDNCFNCKANASECQLCNSPYVLDKRSGSCVSRSDIVPFDDKYCYKNGVIKKCEGFCYRCSRNCSKCLECNEGYWISSDGDSCIVEDYGYRNLYEGYGLNPRDQYPKLHKCYDSKCLDCQKDHMDCFECPPRTMLFKTYLNQTIYAEGGGRRLKGECVNISTRVSPGFGTNQLWIQECTVQSCLKCSDHLNPFTKCEQCIPGYIDPTHSGLLCMKEDWSEDIRGFGMVNGDKLMAKPCSVQYCSECKMNYSECRECQEGYYRYENKCYAPSDVPDGLGIVANRTLDRCKSAQCLRCFNLTHNNSQCDECKPGYIRVKEVNGQCFDPKSQMIPGYGVSKRNELDQVVKMSPCLDKRCHYCPRNYTECNKCKEGYSLNLIPRHTNLLYIPTTICVSSSDIHQGHTTHEGLLVKCGIMGCKYCNDTSSCKVCYEPYMLTHYGLCIPRVSANHMVGWGYTKLAADQGWVMERCTKYVAGCLDCWGEAKNCTTCNNNEGWYYIANPGGKFECVNIFGSDRRLLSNGIKRSSYGKIKAELVPCKHPDCKGCISDYSRCDACISSEFVIDPNTGKCVQSMEGVYSLLNASPQPSTKSLRCHPRGNCKACVENYIYCSSCMPGFSLQQRLCKPEFIVKERSLLNSSIKLEFKLDLASQDTDTLEVYLVSRERDKSAVCPSNQCKVKKDPTNTKNLYIFLRPSSPLQERTIVLKRSSLGMHENAVNIREAVIRNKPFPPIDYFISPISIEGFRVNYHHSTYTNVFTHKFFYSIVNLARGTGTLFMVYQGTTNAMFANEVFSLLFSLDLYNTPPIYFAEKFLEDHIYWRMAVVEMPNPFAQWSNRCHQGVISHLVKQKLACNMLIHFGQNYVALVIMSAFVIVAGWIRELKYKNDARLIQERASHSILVKIIAVLDFKLIVNFTLSIQLTMMILAQFTIINRGDTYESTMGVYFAQITLGYYTLLMILNMYTSEIVWQRLKQLPKEAINSEETQELENLIDFSTLPFQFLTDNFRGLSLPYSRLELYAPLGNYLRSFIISTLIVYFPATPVAQLTYSCALEVITWISRLVYWRILVDKVHGLVSLVSVSLTLFYLSIKIQALDNAYTEEFKQKKLGSALVIMIFLQWFCSLFEIIYAFVRKILTVLSDQKPKSSQHMASKIASSKTSTTSQNQQANSTTPSLSQLNRKALFEVHSTEDFLKKSAEELIYELGGLYSSALKGENLYPSKPSEEQLPHLRQLQTKIKSYEQKK